MYEPLEEIHAMTKANTEAMLSLASSQMAAIEKFATLNASLVKAAFEASSASARALADAKDLQALLRVQGDCAQPVIEKSIACARGAYEVANQVNTEWLKITERRVAEWNGRFVSLLDNAAKSAPAGSDVALSAAKQMVAVANSACDNFSRVARQVAEIAEANVAAATETVKDVPKARKAA